MTTGSKLTDPEQPGTDHSVVTPTGTPTTLRASVKDRSSTHTGRSDPDTDGTPPRPLVSNWWDLAACRGSDPSRWVPEKDRGADYEETRQICAECIVSAECLAHGMAHREIGIWGGTNTNERDRIRRSKS